VAQNFPPGIQGVEKAGNPHVAAGVDQGTDQFFPGVACFQGSFQMAFDLEVGSAQRSQQDYGEKFPGLTVQPGAGTEIPEAELGEEPGNGLGKFSRKPSVLPGNLVPIKRSLESQSFLISLLRILNGPLGGQGKADVIPGENLV